MLNFRQWEADARLFVLAVLFAMPWCSAEDLARVRPYSRAYLGKLLQSLEAEGLVYRVKAGHVAGQVWRWALEERGVAEVCQRCGVRPRWPVFQDGLRYLLWRMDTVEPTYRIMPTLLEHCGGKVEVNQSTVSDLGTLQVDDSYVALVPSDSWLNGFRWCLAPRLDAVGEFADLDENEVQITVARCGIHGREPMAPDTGFRGFAGHEDDRTVTQGFQRLNYEPAAFRLLPHNGTAHIMRTAGVVTISNENDECSQQFALSDYRGTSTVDWHAVFPADDAGNRLGPLVLESSFGKILDPPERGTVMVPDIGSDAGDDPNRGTIPERPSRDPIFQAVNGAMGARVFRKVCSHAVIAYRDIVKDCAPSDRAGVRKSLNLGMAAGLYASYNDCYRLDEYGIQLAAIRDGVAPETVRARFAGMFNQSGVIRKRWLRRKAIIGHLVTELQGNDIQTVEGWRPVLQTWVIPDGGADPDALCPDAWALLQRRRWFALEYLDANLGAGMIETLLKRHSNRRSSPIGGLLAVCETREVEGLVRRSDTGLHMLTTTRRELLTGPDSGNETIWRYRGHPHDLYSLLAGRF